MFANRDLISLLAAAALASGASCNMFSQSQLSALQSQNRSLTEQTRAQLAEIENLKVHSRHVEDQLIHAEEDLARLEQHGGGQKLARPRLPDGVSVQLADMAERFPSLQYDQRLGVC